MADTKKTGKKLTCLSCGQVNRVPQDRLGAGPQCGVCGEKLFASKPVEVDLATLQKAARNDDVALIVDFWAPWCGPCRQMAPQFAQAAAPLRGKARLVKINTEAHPKASQNYRIRGIPTLAAFRAGQERGRQAGAMPAGAIVKWAEGTL